MCPQHPAAAFDFAGAVANLAVGVTHDNSHDFWLAKSVGNQEVQPWNLMNTVVWDAARIHKNAIET